MGLKIWRFKSHWEQFLMKFILFCVTLYLSDNLTEMRLKGLSWKTQLLRIIVGTGEFSCGRNVFFINWQNWTILESARDFSTLDQFMTWVFMLHLQLYFYSFPTLHLQHKFLTHKSIRIWLHLPSFQPLLSWSCDRFQLSTVHGVLFHWCEFSLLWKKQKLNLIWSKWNA